MEDYILKVIEELNKKLVENSMTGEFVPARTVKNNSVIRNGVAYTGSKVSPVIYLDEYYEEYLDTGELHIYEIWTIFSEHLNSMPFDVENMFSDWDSLRNRIIFKLINKNLNKELLESLVYRDVGKELAITYLYLLDVDDGSLIASVSITNQIAEKFVVSEEELYSVAMENTPKLLKPIFKSLSEMLSKMGVPLPRDVPDVMTVITNEKCFYGASVIMYPELLKSISNALQREVLYLIPSSIHELILVNVDGDQASTIPFMIKEINQTEVSPEEVLSDNLYQYDVTTDEISIVSSPR